MEKRKVAIRVAIDETLWQTTLGHDFLDLAIREYFYDWGMTNEDVDIEFIRVKRLQRPKVVVTLTFTPADNDDRDRLSLSEFVAILWTNLVGSEFEDIRVEVTNNRTVAEEV